MSVHSFDTDVASMVGVAAAAIAYNIQHWCEKNAANDAHQYEGRSWTYNSVSAFKELYPYLSPKQIRTALDKLESAGLVVSGNFNKQGRDQTKWYSFVPEAVVKSANCPKGQMQLPKKASPFAQKGKPLPDRKPDNKPTPNGVVSRAKKFPIPADWFPTDEQIQHVVSKGLTREEAIHEADRFRNHFLDQPGTKRPGWHRSYYNWCTGPYGPLARRKQERTRADRPASIGDGFDQVVDQLEPQTQPGWPEERYPASAHIGGPAGTGEATLFDADGSELTWNGEPSDRAA